MNTITVITELCAEDRARLDAIIAALQSPQGKPTEAAQAVEAPALKETQPEEEKPTAPAVAEAAAPTTAEPEPTVTHDDILKKVITLSAAGKKQEAREIVNAYAAKVSDIPAEKLAEVAERLDAIGG